MDIKKIKIADLKLDPNNARRHSPVNITAIEKSLTQFGQRKPIVVDEQNVVIAGNGTLEAAKNLGWKEIAVTIFPLGEDQAKAFAIADNRTSELAQWDAEQLMETLKTLDDALLDSTGFDSQDLDAMEKLFGQAPDLDDLFDEIGEPTDEDGMTRIAFIVPIDVAEKWKVAVASFDGSSDLEKTCAAIEFLFEDQAN